MKIFNISRGKGKTMRMLYASEFNNVPILCDTKAHKSYIVELAKKCEIKIPEPMTVCEFLRSEKTISNKPMSVLIDEMDSVLSSLLSQAFNVNVEAVTITTDKEIV